MIHEVHDMWPVTPIELYGMSKWNPFVVLMQIGENSFLKHSDHIVSLLSHAKGYFMEHGMKPERFVHVPNGVIVSEWEKPDTLPEDLKEQIMELHKKCKMVIGFFGSMTKGYSINHIIDAIKQVEEAGLILVGNGMIKKDLVEQASGCDRILFHDSIPKKMIPSLLNAIDVSYVGAVNNRIFRFGICMNKLFDALMGGKPILYAVNSPNNYINDFQCGVSVKPENTEALVEGIKELLNKTEDERGIMGKNAHVAVLDHFTYKKLAEQFASVF